MGLEINDKRQGAKKAGGQVNVAVCRGRRAGRPIRIRTV
jgi:hypothetical protein